MKWGIAVEWNVRGLICCEWMQRTEENTVDDAMEFESKADAEYFIRTTAAVTYDRILLPQEFAS